MNLAEFLEVDMPNDNLTKRGFFAALAATAVAAVLPRPPLARSIFTKDAFSAADSVVNVWTNRPNLRSVKMTLEHNGKFTEGVLQKDGTVAFESIKIPKGEVFYINSYGTNDL